MHKTKRFRLMAPLVGGFLLLGYVARAQDKPSPSPNGNAAALDQQMALLRKDIRAQRKQLIAANMNLSSSEAEKFWPVYEQYVGELVEINNTKYELIKNYLQSSTNMTADEADNTVKKWLWVDESAAKLRMKYVPIFRKVLSAQSTALFYQLDRRVQLMIDLQLASNIPLIEP